MKQNERVFAISHSDQDAIYVFGFGTYVGDHPLESNTGGLVSLAGHLNPKIVLDSGKVVWGCECWWGPEKDFEKQSKGYKVINVDIDVSRAAERSELN